MQAVKIFCPVLHKNGISGTLYFAELCSELCVAEGEINAFFKLSVFTLFPGSDNDSLLCHSGQIH